MSVHSATIRWSRATPDYTYETYDRSHTWAFGTGTTIAGSAAPEFRGDGTKVNPEEALVGALSSCHMLTFLAIAAKKGFTVDRYTDAAEGTLEKKDGRMWVTKVVLRPAVEFAAPVPSPEVIANLHASAHAGCFIANSVKTEVVIEPA